MKHNNKGRVRTYVVLRNNGLEEVQDRHTETESEIIEFENVCGNVIPESNNDGNSASDAGGLHGMRNMKSGKKRRSTGLGAEGEDGKRTRRKMICSMNDFVLIKDGIVLNKKSSGQGGSSAYGLTERENFKRSIKKCGKFISNLETLWDDTPYF